MPTIPPARPTIPPTPRRLPAPESLHGGFPTFPSPRQNDQIVRLIQLDSITEPPTTPKKLDHLSNLSNT